MNPTTPLASADPMASLLAFLGIAALAVGIFAGSVWIGNYFDGSGK